MNRNFKRALGIILSAAMVLAMTACGADEKTTTDNTESQKQTEVEQVSYDKASESYKKSETVFVNMDKSGKVTSKIVTDWLHTETPETYIDDVSDLDDIKNVKNNVEPVSGSGGALRWNMQTTDLYYRGKTDKALPVSFDISYYLNGEKTDAADMAGKSGQVKMVITVNNLSKKEATINGKKTVIYTPFIVGGGMILNENTFSNVSVENGKTIGDGTKEIALLVGVPGLKESLNLNDDLLKELGDFNFSNTYTVTAETEKFEISNMMFAVIPLSAVEAGLNDTLPKTIDEVRSTLTKVQSIIDKFNSMNAAELLNTLFANGDRLTELTGKLGEVTQLYNDNKALIEVIEKYMTEENIAAIKKFIDDTENTDLDEVVKLLSNPVLQRFFKQLPTLAGDMQKVMPIISGLSSDLKDPEVQKAVNNLPQTLKTLKELKTTLDENKELFNKLTSVLDKDTINQIQDIMESLDGMISEDMIKQYLGLADNADEIISRAKEWIAAGKAYNIFTTAKDNARTSVVFVYESAPVTAPKAEVKTEAVTSQGEKPIVSWFNKLFKKDN